MKNGNAITIDSSPHVTHGGKWRAFTSVRSDLNAPKGAATESGPWVEGFGNTPEAAILAMYEEIGRLYVQTL